MEQEEAGDQVKVLVAGEEVRGSRRAFESSNWVRHYAGALDPVSITTDWAIPSLLALTALWGIDEAIGAKCYDEGSRGLWEQRGVPNPDWSGSEMMASKLRIKGQVNQPGGFMRL